MARKALGTKRPDTNVDKPALFTNAEGEEVSSPSFGVCCLGMHFRPWSKKVDSDNERIRSMLNNLQVDGVLSVAWGDASYPGFYESDLRRIKPAVLDACGAHAKVVALDYFWLQSSYYETNYGTNWASEKVQTFLDKGVPCVILPYDKEGEKRQLETTGSLFEQIQRAKAAGLCPPYFDISWEEAKELHPLVKASEEKYIDLVTTKNIPVSLSAFNLYLNDTRTFAVFHRQDQTETTIKDLLTMHLR